MNYSLNIKSDLFRIGKYYSEIDDSSSVDCPPFWNSRKIIISHVNFKNETYMDNIRTAAFIGMSLNVAMVILFLVTFKGKFKKLYKAYYTSSSWKCITFSSFFKRWFFVTFPFFEVLSPLSDSILGRSLIFKLLNCSASLLDAIYFGSLEKDDILVHVDSKVIQAMAAFVFISVLKDFLIGFYLHWTYEGRLEVQKYNHL